MAPKSTKSGMLLGVEYTPAELMVAAAAREIRDGEVVFVGMRLPLIAFAVAKRTLALRAVGLFESGLLRDVPATDLLYTMADGPNVAGATWATGLWEVMSTLQRGEVDLGFIGGAEVDMHGNLNTSRIGPRDQPAVQLPGSGGAADIAGLARRAVIIMPHEKRRLRPAVDYITSLGHGAGSGRGGAPGGGPDALITTLGVFGFEAGRAVLRSYHPSTSVEEIRHKTGWEIVTAPNLASTTPPSPDELAAIRSYDPTGFWTA